MDFDEQKREHPRIQLDTAKKFITALTGDKDTPCFFQTFDDNKDRRNSNLIDTSYSSLTDIEERLQLLNENGAGVFVTINETKDGSSRKAENIVGLRALFIDMDGKEELPDTWHLEPSIIVQRDATHWHTYWLLNEGEDVGQFKDAQKQLIQFYDSDKAIHDLCRVMRVPGFLHQKGEPIIPTIKKINPELKYSIEQVLEAHGINEITCLKNKDNQQVDLSGLLNSMGYESENSNDKWTKQPEEHSFKNYRSWALAVPMVTGERHDTLKNIAIEGCARNFSQDEVLEVAKEWARDAGMESVQEVNELVDWAFSNNGEWEANSPVCEEVFDSEAFLEHVREKANEDKEKALKEVYSTCDQWCILKSNEFSIFKMDLKAIFKSLLNLNDLGTMRKDALKVVQKEKKDKILNTIKDKDMILDRRDPLKIAEVFIEKVFKNKSDVSFLQRFGGEFWRYEGTHYDFKNNEWLRTCLYNFLEKAKTETDDGYEDFKPCISIVNNVIDALISQVFIDDIDDMPFWIQRLGNCIEPKNIIAFNNGLLNIEKPEEPLIKHTPTWFSASCLPFDYEPWAECPIWLQCLDGWFEGDKETILALQLFIGYILSQDTSQQKIGFFVGPPRAGKGTTGRVLQKLLGPNNVCNPTLNSLTGEFGTAPLIGKQLAFIGDAHLSKGKDSAQVLDVLKSISGEDSTTVNRKFKDQQTMKFSTRFIIAANQLDQFPDPSGALASRLIVFNFRASYLGSENLDLDSELENELSGIANWALKGLAMLRERGKLLQPETGKIVANEFKRLGSPVSAFIDDCCVNDGEVTVDLLYQIWKIWCQNEGREAGSKQSFGSKLHSSLPQLKTKQRRGEESRYRYYSGLSLNDEGIILKKQVCSFEGQYL